MRVPIPFDNSTVSYAPTTTALTLSTIKVLVPVNNIPRVPVLCKYVLRKNHMPSNKPVLMTYTTPDIINEFKRIAQEENRSMSKQLEYIVKKYISDYKTEHGMINISESGDSSNLPGGGTK